MALVDELPEGANIALDTDAIIYYVEEHTRYLPIVEPLIEAIVSGTYKAHVSVISLAEVLVRPIRENRPDLAQAYRDILAGSATAELHSVDVATVERAARIRAEFFLGMPDSIIAAMAQMTGCSHLITNNARDFRKVADLGVLAINDFV